MNSLRHGVFQSGIEPSSVEFEVVFGVCQAKLKLATAMEFGYRQTCKVRGEEKLQLQLMLDALL